MWYVCVCVHVSMRVFVYVHCALLGLTTVCVHIEKANGDTVAGLFGQ